MAALIFGSNTFTNCQQALVVCGKEVFRLRDRDGDGQLSADFDLCDGAGLPLAKVAKNHIVQALPGMTVRHGPDFTEVADASGKVIGRAQAVTPETVRVIGTFGAHGAIVDARPDVLHLPGSGSMRGCSFSGSGAAIEVSAQGALSLGAPPSPRPRPGFRQKAVTPQFKNQSKRRR